MRKITHLQIELASQHLQIALASELESDLQDTVDWGKKRLQCGLQCWENSDVFI